MAHDDLKKIKPIRIDGAGESGKLLAVDTAGHVEFTNTLMGPLTVSGDLMPAVSGQFNIGTSGANSPWKEIHTDSLFVGGRSVVSSGVSGLQNLGSSGDPIGEFFVSSNSVNFMDGGGDPPILMGRLGTQHLGWSNQMGVAVRGELHYRNEWMCRDSVDGEGVGGDFGYGMIPRSWFSWALDDNLQQGPHFVAIDGMSTPSTATAPSGRMLWATGVLEPTNRGRNVEATMITGDYNQVRLHSNSFKKLTVDASLVVERTDGGTDGHPSYIAIIGENSSNTPTDIPALTLKNITTPATALTGYLSASIGALNLSTKSLHPLTFHAGGDTDINHHSMRIDVGGRVVIEDTLGGEGNLVVGNNITGSGLLHLPNLPASANNESSILVSGIGGKIFTAPAATLLSITNPGGTAAGGTNGDVQYNYGGVLAGSSNVRHLGGALQFNSNFGAGTGITGVLMAVNSGVYHEMTIGTSSTGHVAFYTNNQRRGFVTNDGTFGFLGHAVCNNPTATLSSSGHIVADRHFCAAGVVVGKDFFTGVGGASVPHLGTKSGIPVNGHGVLNISGSSAEGMQRVVLHSVEGPGEKLIGQPGFIAYNTTQDKQVGIYADANGGRLSSDGVLKIAPWDPTDAAGTPQTDTFNVIISGYETEFCAGGHPYMTGRAGYYGTATNSAYLEITNDLLLNQLEPMTVNTSSTGILVSGTNGRVEARKWVGPSSNVQALLIDDDTMTDDSNVCGATQQSIKAYVAANGGGGGAFQFQNYSSLGAGVSVAGSPTLMDKVLSITTPTGTVGTLFLIQVNVSFTIEDLGSGVFEDVYGQLFRDAVAIGPLFHDWNHNNASYDRWTSPLSQANVDVNGSFSFTFGDTQTLPTAGIEYSFRMYGTNSPPSAGLPTPAISIPITAASMTIHKS
jgi:hypothetical protein